MWPFKEKDYTVKDKTTPLTICLEFDKPIRNFYVPNFKNAIYENISKKVSEKFGKPDLVSLDQTDFSRLDGAAKKCFVDIKVHELFHPIDGRTEIVAGVNEVYVTDSSAPRLINIRIIEDK